SPHERFRVHHGHKYPLRGALRQPTPPLALVHHPEVVLSGVVSTVDSSTTPSWGFAKGRSLECNRALQARVGHRTTCPSLPAPSLAHGGRGVFNFSSVIFFVLERAKPVIAIWHRWVGDNLAHPGNLTPLGNPR